MQNDLSRPTFLQKNRVITKAVFVGILILVLLIPTLFIENLVSERRARREEVVSEVSKKWSGAQTLSGPYLILPYATHDTDRKHTIITKYLYILPDELKINARLIPETRARSIYKVPVYNADVIFQGSFGNLKEGEGEPLKDFQFQNARLCVAISDMKGINEDVLLKWNDTNLPFDIASAEELLGDGISSRVTVNEGITSKATQFSVHIRLKGSQKIFFTPLGSTTSLHMESSWTNPAFDGKYLPDSHTVSANGFIADWKVLHFNRNFPKQFTNQTQNAAFINEAAFGLNFLQPIDAYSQTERSIKYAILLISLTFFLYFFIEILQQNAVHPMQYMLVGFALVVFYSLLLSISEYTSFKVAYLLSSAATILLIGWYTKSVFGKWQVSFIFSMVLSLLYLFIYVLIQLQDYALLFGTIGLFILLATVMYFSRKVNWFSSDKLELQPVHSEI